MKTFSLSLIIVVFALAQAFVPRAAVAAEGGDAGLTVIVMDPLALPLSCPCVKGYAQRDYDQLGKFLEGRLHQPVRVVFSESVRKALDKKTEGKADLIIGKDSVVRRQTKRAGIGVVHVAALTGLDGKTVQTGLWVVPAKDPALSISDLKGYRIILGPEDCDEKHLAAENLMVEMGLPKIKKPETCSACSDGATPYHCPLQRGDEIGHRHLELRQAFARGMRHDQEGRFRRDRRDGTGSLRRRVRQ